MENDQHDFNALTNPNADESNGPTATDVERFNRVEHILKGHHPEIQQLIFVKITSFPVTHCVLAKTSFKRLDEPQWTLIATSIVKIGSEAGLTLLPVIHSQEHVDQFGHMLHENEWTSLFDPQERPARLIDHYRSKSDYPSSLRKWLLKVIEEQLGFLEFLQQSLMLPSHVALEFSAALLRDALELLYATKGKKFTNDMSAMAIFKEHFLPCGHWNEKDMLLFFQLGGLSQQARHAYYLTGKDEGSIDWLPYIKRVIQFMTAFKRYLQTELTTAAERQRKKRNQWIAAGVTVCLLLAGGIGHTIKTWPESPISDVSVIVKTGGITGDYYTGDQKNVFQKKVLSRSDTSLNFDTMGSLDPKLPADFFGIRWNGYLFFPTSGIYHLCTEADDKLQLRFNGNLIINDTTGRDPRMCKKIRVKKGWYPISVQFEEHTFGAVLRLLRGEDEAHATLVSAQHLCCRND